LQFDILFRVNVHEFIDIGECLMCSHLLLEQIRALLIFELPLDLFEKGLLLHAFEAQPLVLLLRQRVVAPGQLRLDPLLLNSQGARVGNLYRISRGFLEVPHVFAHFAHFMLEVLEVHTDQVLIRVDNLLHLLLLSEGI